MFFSLNYKSILILLTIIQIAKSNLSILKITDAENPNRETLKLCGKKYEYDDSLKDYYVKIPLLDVTPYNGCKSINNDTFANKSTFMRLYDGLDCSLYKMLMNLKVNNVRFAILGLNGPTKVNHTNINETIAPIFLHKDQSELLSSYINSSVQPMIELASAKQKFDLSLMFIWLLAICTVVFGSLWSGYEFKDTLKSQEESEHVEINNVESAVVANSTNSDKQDAVLLNLNYVGILVLLGFVIAILLLLYYFYSYIIYFVYVIFIFGVITSMYRIFCLIFDPFDYGKCKLPENNIPLLKARPQVIHVILTIFCISLAIVWFIFRHSSWIWILQDFMSISLAANALSFYRLSSYRIVTFMLVLFLFYDVFMVYITPYLTKGNSIMEVVALGGHDSSSKQPKTGEEIIFNPFETVERLPVVIIIPNLSKNAQLCASFNSFPFSLLGLGDLLIPGLSMIYANLYDIATNNRFKVYFIVNILAYGVGLILAFIGLILMDKPQPALVFLCPTHLVFTIAFAYFRNEFYSLWSGEPIRQYTLNRKSTRSIVNPESGVDTVQQEQPLQ